MKALAPRGAESERFIEWLPAHADLRDENVGVIVAELFEPARGRELQGANARQWICSANNGDGRLRIESIGLSAGIGDKSLAETNYIAFDI